MAHCPFTRANCKNALHLSFYQFARTQVQSAGLGIHRRTADGEGRPMRTKGVPTIPSRGKTDCGPPAAPVGGMCVSPVPGASPTAQGSAPHAGTRSVSLPAARASPLAPKGPAADRAQLFATAMGASGEAPGRPRPQGGTRGLSGRATAGSREGRASQRLTFFVCSKLDGGRR